MNERKFLWQKSIYVQNHAFKLKETQIKNRFSLLQTTLWMQNEDENISNSPSKSEEGESNGVNEPNVGEDNKLPTTSSPSILKVEHGNNFMWIVSKFEKL